MLGFMMKDFLYFRRNTRLFALMVVLYLVFGFSMSNVAAISGMLSMLGLIVVLNCFTADEAAHWDEYGLSLPVSRKNAVRARYLLGLLLMLVSLVLVLISAVILCSLNSSLVLSEEVSACILTPVLLLLMSSASMPLCYKYGVEKGRVAMMAMMMAIFLLIFGGATLLSRDGSVSRAISQASGDELPAPILLCTALISLALYYVSYRFSLRFYINREF